jgi:hypothetical protein
MWPEQRSMGEKGGKKEDGWRQITKHLVGQGWGMEF